MESYSVSVSFPRERKSEGRLRSETSMASGMAEAAWEETVMTADLNHKNDRLRKTINQLVESHPELEVFVRDVASRQPPNATPE
jgi:hypothetical protein